MRASSSSSEASRYASGICPCRGMEAGAASAIEAPGPYDGAQAAAPAGASKAQGPLARSWLQVPPPAGRARASSRVMSSMVVLTDAMVFSVVMPYLLVAAGRAVIRLFTGLAERSVVPLRGGAGIAVEPRRPVPAALDVFVRFLDVRGGTQL